MAAADQALALLSQAKALGALPALLRSCVRGAKAEALIREFEEQTVGLSRINSLAGEAKACAIFDYLLRSAGHPICNLFASDVAEAHKEVRTASGIADRVLTHVDGSRTAVEIKPRGDRRSQIAGLGQALMYAASLREEGFGVVQAMLVADGREDRWVRMACESAGVLYFPLGDMGAGVELLSRAMRGEHLG